MGLFSRRPPERPAAPFVFVVEDLFTITGVGPVLTGRVTSGWMTRGQASSLLLPQGRRDVTIRRIESSRRKSLQVDAGAQAGVVLDGLEDGDIPTKPGGDHRVIDSAALRGVELVSR